MEYTAVTYARVSSTEQSLGYSTESQLKTLQEYAQKNSLKIKQIFKEAESAKKAGRTQFNEMLTFVVKNKAIKHIIVEKTDRLLRNFKDCMHINDLIEEHGVFVHLVKEGTVLHKDSASSSKMMFGIRAVVSKNFVDNLSEETKKGMLEKAEQLVYPSFAPYGFLNCEINKRKVLIPDPIASKHVKRMFELYATGNYSLLSLKRKMLEEGMVYRNGKNFYKHTVETILKNEFYTGVFFWKGKKYENAQHEALISKELFRQVQIILRKPKKYKSRKDMFVFANLMECGVCGFSITAQVQKKRHIYYHCTGYAKSLSQATDCNQPYTRQEIIDEQISGVLSHMQLPEDVQKNILEDVSAVFEEERDRNKAYCYNIEQEIKTIQRRIDQSYIDKLDGNISEKFWKEKTQEWIMKKEELNQKLTQLSKPNTEHIQKCSEILELAKNAFYLYKMANSEQKRKLMGMLFSNAKLFNGLLDLKLKEPYRQILESANSGNWRP